MSFSRFRIRTYMIAVAIVAVLTPLFLDLLPLLYAPAYDAWLDTGDQGAYVPAWFNR